MDITSTQQCGGRKALTLAIMAIPILEDGFNLLSFIAISIAITGFHVHP